MAGKRAKKENSLRVRQIEYVLENMHSVRGLAEKRAIRYEKLMLQDSTHMVYP